MRKRKGKFLSSNNWDLHLGKDLDKHHRKLGKTSEKRSAVKDSQHSYEFRFFFEVFLPSLSVTPLRDLHPIFF